MYSGIATPKLLRGWTVEERWIVVGDSRKRIHEFKGFIAVVPNDYEATTASGFYEILTAKTQRSQGTF